MIPSPHTDPPAAWRHRALVAAALLAAATAFACDEPRPKAADTASQASDVADTAAQSEISADDIDSAGPEPDSGPACPGAAGCACKAATECTSALCIQTQAGGTCTDYCGDGNCPAGWSCQGQSGGGDGTYFCIPDAGLLCRPCDDHAACRASGLAAAAFVEYGDSGAFCGLPCASDASCPQGSACRDVEGVDGGPVKQCVLPGAGPAGLGVCECPPVSKVEAHGTACWLVDGEGALQRRCKGRRVCGPAGLGTCTALKRAEALCLDVQCLDALTGLPKADGAACDDGRACTQGDTCKAGVCGAGEANICSCEPGFKACAAAAGAVNKCAGPLICAATNNADVPFACVANGADAVNCDDSGDGPCVKNACVPLSGACTPTAVERTVEVCDLPGSAGSQQPGCRREVLAAELPDGPAAPCDDGLGCSVGDSCKNASCSVTDATACKCKADADCQDDGDLCNGTPYCDKSDAKLWGCKINPATVISCDTSGDSGCLQTACVPKAGTCLKDVAPAGTACSDGVACTIGDVCDSEGKCQPGTWTCCKTDADCAGEEDGDLCNGTLFCNKAAGACTLNPSTKVTCPTANDTACLQTACVKATGQCAPQPVNDTKPCDDGQTCTDGDVCADGACKGGSDTCPCQVDADCQSKEDSDLCNGTLYCNKALGQCKPNPKTIVVCQTVDDTDCKANTCIKTTGKCAVQALPSKALCDFDGTACTANDACDGQGACEAGTPVCACLSDADCAAKDDGDLCNGTLYCDKSGPMPVCKLKAASVLSCPSVDDTACQKNQCQPKSGECKFVALSAGAPCDDGEPCTGGDGCDGKGGCKAGASAGCGCKLNSDCALFDDGDVCNGGYGCKSGACVFDAKVLVCDDNNACTTDSCDKAKGCVAVALPDCAICVADKDCGDGNTCTFDFCLVGTCKWPAAQGSCEDGDACTEKDTCVNAVCEAGAPKSCDDGKVCTDDSCDAKAGCKVANNTAPCDADGSVCSENDACAGGMCKAGAAKDCDDKQSCTADSCDKTKGCGHQAGSEGLSCSEAQYGLCAGGTCKAQPCPPGYDPVEVDDGGTKKTACAAYEPVWGNRPDKPVGVYAVSEPVSGAGKVVVDSQTKLMWQQATAPNTMTWQNAKDYCEALSYAGFKDWRLPSSVELETMVDYSIAPPEPTIDQSAFPGTKQTAHWSASLRAGSSSGAWGVNFYYGYVFSYVISNSSGVRCVRGS